MKLFLNNNTEQAIQYRQLLHLQSECASLQWSASIQVPDEVAEALETIQRFTEGKIKDCCSLGTEFDVLCDQEENALYSALKNYPSVKQILGSGVVLAGAEAAEMLSQIQQDQSLRKIAEALKSGKNILLA